MPFGNNTYYKKASLFSVVIVSFSVVLASAFSPSSAIQRSSIGGSYNGRSIGQSDASSRVFPSHRERRQDFRTNPSASSTQLHSDMFPGLFRENPLRNKVLAVLAGLVLVTATGSVVIEPGEIGIASTLGTIERYDPGLHFKSPLSTVTRLSTKTELLEQSNFVPTKEGLTVELDTAVLVRLDPDQTLDLYRSVGSDFVRKLVIPEASSSVRGLTSESEAKALYTAGRSELQTQMKDELSTKLGPKGIVVEDVLLKNVVLPKDLSASIQEKARAEQESARMEFVLNKETQEAKRKAIEAGGIAEFQKIVSEGITPGLLQWKGIEATEKLANSPNSKVVIVGNSKNSLPVILGSGDGKN
jgi:regulator of protease activity HflC (stomatin/prohibitin superfamily)